MFVKLTTGQKVQECFTPQPSQQRLSCETPQLDESLSRERFLEEEIMSENGHFRKKLFSDCSERSYNIHDPYNIHDQVTEYIQFSVK
jgi:hypothetical protein